MINDKLRTIYEANLDGFRCIMERNDQDDIGLDGPGLMYCHEEFYLAADMRILFVGKEGGTAAGWTTDNIAGQMEGQRKFAFSTNKENNNPMYKSPRSPFWLAVWEMNNMLNPRMADRPCFLQSNVSRYSLDGDPILPEDFDWIHEIVNLLPQEVKVVEPDVVIFFSGPNFDEYIRSQFGSDLTFEPAIAYTDVRQIARVIHPTLPKNTYRMYHPRALRKGKWHYIELIASLIMGYDPQTLLIKLFAEMEVLAKYFEMKMRYSPGESIVGSADSYFWFFRPDWKYIGIGFGFDIALGGFYYGICRKDMNVAIPEKVAESIQENLAPCDGDPTLHWPWWKWHTSGNWGVATFQAIQSGDFSEDLKGYIMQLIEWIGDVED